MGAADGEALVVVLPRGKEKELTAHAGIHALTAGLGEVGKAVFLKDNQGKAFLKGGTHDLFLARGDAGRHQDGTTTGKRQTLGKPG